MMIKPKFLVRTVVAIVCTLTLVLILEAGFVSIAWSNPSSVDRYGYAMFKDGDSDWIWGDREGQYIDYRNNGGEDKVLINVDAGSGSLNYVQFYPGKMYQYNSIPSTRSVLFRFNVSGIEEATGVAVCDILRWYKKGKSYFERSTNHGWIDDKSLHVPILASSSKFHLNIVQFVIEPNVDKPGTDPKATTLEKVRDYYDQSELSYWYTTDEPAEYIIYNIDYGISEKDKNGFIIMPIQWDSKRKPITWIIKPNPTRTTPVTLTVKTPDSYGQMVVLAQYTNVPFELAVSLNPLSSYPICDPNPAPKRYNNISNTWGEVKN